jgi:hypothetical protein
MSTRKFCRRALAVILLILGATAGIVWFRGKPFDQVAWTDDGRVRGGIRLAMADRLITRRTLNGKTRNEVLAMLGQPPPTNYFREWDLVYWLGRERGFISIDSEWLVLRFNCNGRVSEVRIVTD